MGLLRVAVRPAITFLASAVELSLINDISNSPSVGIEPLLLVRLGPTLSTNASRERICLVSGIVIRTNTLAETLVS